MRYRTRTRKVQVIRVTQSVYDGTERLPAGVDIGMSRPGDYLVRWVPGGEWMAVAGNMFEQDYELDEPGQLLRIAT